MRLDKRMKSKEQECGLHLNSNVIKKRMKMITRRNKRKNRIRRRSKQECVQSPFVFTYVKYTGYDSLRSKLSIHCRNDDEGNCIFYGAILHLMKKVMSNCTYGIVTTSRKQYIMRFRILYFDRYKGTYLK